MRKLLALVFILALVGALRDAEEEGEAARRRHIRLRFRRQRDRDLDADGRQDPSERNDSQVRTGADFNPVLATSAERGELLRRRT